MRTIPTALNNELLKKANFLAHLVELYLDTTLYYTTLDVDLWYDGHQYLSRGINLSEANYSLAPQIDKMTLEFDNTGLEFSSIILNQETRGKKAIVRLIALNNPAVVIADGIYFSGVLDECRIDHKSCTFDLYSPWVFWKRQTPRRIHQATCNWAFKSPECAYAGGESWCDQSWDRCLALGNTANFGGFRWLPGLVNKQIWWGRSPKE